MEPSEAVAILRRRLEERLPDERRTAAAIRAVEGLARDALFRAMARAADVAGRPVDIVPLEDVRPRLLAIIERDGQVIRD